MMKFIRGRGAHVNAERLKLQKELFQFNQTLFHGFPHRPSALAYCNKLNLIAIGTREGSLRVYGRPGVEFQALIDQERKIDSILFIENTSQLIVKCEDNSIHLFEIPNNLSADVNSSELILIKSFEQFVVDLENDEKTNSNRITTLTVHSSHSKILIATEDGTIHILNTKKFELDENHAVTLDKVQSQLPNDQPRLLGAAEQIIEHPIDQDRILIGYNRGQLVLWNLQNEKLEKFYASGQQLESVCWLSATGNEFISSHNDGSYIIWNTNDNVQPSQQSKIPYGPFPCKPINKIYGDSTDNLIIFNGGMPRQLHGERHTVSVIEGINDSAKHQVLELTSKIIDFVVLQSNKALIILAEEEIVAIDLNDSEWSQFKLPYLSSVHSSPITFNNIYSNIPDRLIDTLKEIGLKQSIGKYSSRQWPVQGGILKDKVYSSNNVLLITGHENGCVRLWNISDCAMNPLCTINTAKYFGTEDDITPIDQDDQDDGDEWPPFKKVGIFDPFSDDPRLGIRRAVLCPKTFNLLVAGTAGQIIIFELREETVQLQLTRETIDLVSGLDFIWKSHECLPLENNLITIEPGYHPKSIVQLNPPASVTALALNTDWGLFSAGTTHGFAIFSYELNKSVAYKCTLNPTEISNVNGSGNLITRKKSFRKSLRESFRKLRKGRSMRLTKKSGDKSSPLTSPKSKGSKPEGLDSRPIERQVEAKTEDGIGSVVRYLYFADAPIINPGQFQHTLWAGTNAGTIFIYLINDVKEESNQNNSVNEAKTTTVNETTSTNDENTATTTEQTNHQNQLTNQASTSDNANEQKNNEIGETPIDAKASPSLTCIITKEIQLKHHAPVIFIQVVDHTGHPIEEKTVEEHQQTEGGVIRVLIGSEEQFKLFNLPNLKPYCKFKLTAQEGAKSRRIDVSKFVSKSDSNHSENCIVNVTNQGDLGIFSILDLKKQLNSKCTKKEDVTGISSLVFAKNGEGVFLNSPCEFSRFSLSAQRIVKPNCLISESNLDKIVIEIEKIEEQVVNEPANQSSDISNNAQQLNQSTNEETSTSQDDSFANHQTSANSTQKESNSIDKKDKPKNSDNQTPLAKVKTTVVEKVIEDKVLDKNLDKNLDNDKKMNVTEKVVDNVVINSTVPKIVEEHTEVKILETIKHDCCVKQLHSSPPKSNEESEQFEIKEKPVLSKKQQNGNLKTSFVEVHHHNSDLNGLNLNGSNVDHKNNLISDLVDEDEGEGKSIEEDILLDKSEDNNLEKSNGTPTSGIIDDDDDSFLDTNDLNNSRTSPINEIKHIENNHHKESVKKWNNLNETEIKEVESVNNSTTIDHSFNLTNTNDLTVDSIKEHFNNLNLNEVDLLLDHKDDYN